MFSPSIFTLIFLPAAVIVAALLTAEFVKRRWMESRIQKRLPDAKRVGNLDERRLLELRRTIGSNISRQLSRLPAHERELTQHALWFAMLLEAGADETIDAEEADFIAKLYGEMVSNEPDLRLVFEESERLTQKRSSALSEISKAVGITTHSKFNILLGAFMVSISNKVLEPSEARWLKEIADGLELSSAERALMFDELSDILDLKVARREFMYWESPAWQARMGKRT